MKAIALIPARGGSKRVPRKNCMMLGGIPLVAHTIVLAKMLDIPVYVSTEDKVIATVSREYGAEVINRPVEFATDSSGDREVIAHAISEVPGDLIVYLRPSTPFRTIDRVRDAIRLMSVPGYDSLRSVEEMGESAYKCFRIKAKMLHPLTRKDYTDMPNQELVKTYRPNGYVDIVRREIVESGAIWGGGRYAFITPRSAEIDTWEDWQYAEFILERRK